MNTFIEKQTSPLLLLSAIIISLASSFALCCDSESQESCDSEAIGLEIGYRKMSIFRCFPDPTDFLPSFHKALQSPEDFIIYWRTDL